MLILLIVDDGNTQEARAGDEWFAIGGYDVKPDTLTFAKLFAAMSNRLSRRTFFRKQVANKQAAKGSAKITNYFAAVQPRHEEHNENDGPKEGEQPEEEEDKVDEETELAGNDTLAAIKRDLLMPRRNTRTT
ncbi:uncharacterized protein CCR75_006420 [Bremia lactucae]|uniref:Uncharacterized protein n=1 Tax=Bremia lactucae TaxID=4779 RepID=A0A976IG51_BRELC|nr:hypothetical protein CCR75_006420 [Bremia lactucae]